MIKIKKKLKIFLIIPILFFLAKWMENLNYLVVMQEKIPADPKKRVKKI